MKRPGQIFTQQLSWAWWWWGDSESWGLQGQGQGQGQELMEPTLCPGLPGQALGRSVGVRADQAAGRTACGRVCARPRHCQSGYRTPHAAARRSQAGPAGKACYSVRSQRPRVPGLPPPCGPSTDSSCGFRHRGPVWWGQPASGGPGRASGCDLLSRRLERQQGRQDTASGHSDEGQSPSTRPLRTI